MLFWINILCYFDGSCPQEEMLLETLIVLRMYCIQFHCNTDNDYHQIIIVIIPQPQHAQFTASMKIIFIIRSYLDHT